MDHIDTFYICICICSERGILIMVSLLNFKYYRAIKSNKRQIKVKIQI